jgi:flagellar motor switch protein FliN/FliY
MDEREDQNTPQEDFSPDNLSAAAGDSPSIQMPPPESEAVEPAGHVDDEMISQDSVDNILKGMSSDSPEDMPEEAPPQPVVSKADFQQLSMNSVEKKSQNIDLLMDVDLPVSIELGRTKMSISEILAMGPGSIVELDKLVGEPVDLLVNQKCVARGEVVVVEESFGLRITQLMSPEERIKNLQ